MNEKTLRYVEFVLKINKELNLTACRTKDVFIERLVEPSIKVIESLEIEDGNKIIDIGSGAGIPGIPMAIELEKCNVTLVESVKKKSTFLNNARENLSLENLEVINQRAELLGQDSNYREKFDFAVSRALGGFGATFELLAPFVKVNGAAVIFRGTNEKYKLNLNEIKKELGLHLERKLNSIFDGVVWIFKKIAPTDSTYPRRVGFPAKREMFIIRKKK